MSPRKLLLWAVLLAASPLCGREKTDILLMKNGDRITCEIKGLASNVLHIKIPYILSTLSLDWTKVDHVESKQLFLVKTRDGSVHTGTLSTPASPSGRPTELQIVDAPEKTVVLERNQVVEISETSDKFWNRFNGQIGSGFSYSKGNQSTQYSLNTDVNYPRERWSAGVAYSSNLTSNTGATTSTRNDLTATAQRLLRWNNWFCTGLADFLQSSVQGIQLQSSVGGGIGRYIKRTGGTTFSVYGGFAWQGINYQQSVTPATTQNVASGLVGTELRLYRFDRTTLVVTANLLPAINQPGRVHFITNASYYVKIWSKLNWNFTFYGNWDNQPPPSFSGSDYGATSGLSLSFGSR